MLKGPSTARTSASDEPSPAQLAKDIESYLAERPEAAVLEDGRIIFDMRTAKYSITESHGRCLLQFWSEERNLVRTVVGVDQRAACLRIAIRRLGAPKPESLEIVPSRDRRTPTARDQQRRNYQRLLERILPRALHGWKVDGMRSARYDSMSLASCAGEGSPDADVRAVDGPLSMAYQPIRWPRRVM